MAILLVLDWDLNAFSMGFPMSCHPASAPAFALQDVHPALRSVAAKLPAVM
jgi:hypothetical protein